MSRWFHLTLGGRSAWEDSLAKSSLFIFLTMMLQELVFGIDPDQPKPDPTYTTMPMTHILQPFNVTVAERKM